MAAPGAVASWRWWLAAGAVIWTLAVLATAPLAGDVLAEDRPPLWDMAKNGRQAAQLALDLRRLDLVDFLVHLNRHDPWPFAYSLLLLPVLVVAGPSFTAATAAQAALFTLLPLAILWAGREIDPSPAGLAAAIPAAALAATSPLLLLHGLLLLREIPGALGTLVALALYLRARRLGTLASWRWAGGAALALTLTKYNYGLLVLAAAAIDTLMRRGPDERRRLLTSARRWAGLARDSAWANRLLAAGWLGLAIAHLAGASIDGGLYGLFVVSLGVGLIRSGTRWPWRGRTPAARALVETLALPLGLWFLMPRPMHLRGLLDFLANRSSGLALGEDLVFYPRTFAIEATSGPVWFGVLLLIVTVVGGVLLVRERQVAGRSLALVAALGFLLAVFHPYKQPRFLATIVPLLLLLAGWGAVRIARRASLQATVAILLCLPAFTAAADRPRLAELHRQHSADPRIEEVLAFVRRVAPSTGRFITLGGFNELSPDLIAWEVIARPGDRTEALPPLPRGDLEAGLRKRRADWILAVRVAESSAFAATEDYRAHAAWQRPLLEQLDRLHWRLLAQKRFDELGLELEVRSPAGA